MAGLLPLHGQHQQRGEAETAQGASGGHGAVMIWLDASTSTP
jgi:hypothetical protein